MSDVDVIVRSRALATAPPAPRRLTLQVTNLCNSRCTMCSIWRIYRDRVEDLASELSAAEWLRVVKSSVTAGVRHIDITGGEPFMKDGIEDLTVMVLDLLGFTSVVTNAVTPSGTAAAIDRILTRSPGGVTLAVTVSIDGLPETNAELRGIPDGYQRACRLLASLQELRATFPGLSPNVSFTMQRDNLGDLVPLLETLLGENLIASPDHFYFRPVASLHYYRTGNRGPGAPEAIREIERAQEQFGFAASATFLEGVKTHLRKPERMILPCYASFASCWIDPYGAVSPCVTMTDEPFGHLRDTDLDLGRVWHSPEANAARARIASDACPVCWTDCQATENIFYAGAIT